MKKESLFRKAVAFAVIVLFVGLTVTASITASTHTLSLVTSSVNPYDEDTLYSASSISDLVIEDIENDNVSNSKNDNRGYGHRYAMIVEGPSGSQYLYNYYTRDVARLYNVLRDNYSFTNDEIYVLFALENYNPHPEFDPSIIDYESTETNLQMVLNKFKEGGENEMDDDDLLFLCWIGHGGTSGGNTNFPLAEGTVYDYEFANYVEGIKGTLVLTLQPCNSGGFIEELSSQNRLVLTSVRKDESEGGWIRLFYQGLKGEADEDSEIGNQDGYVSLEEAHHYAARHVYVNEGKHSLLDDNGDAIGHHYTSSGYDPNDPSKDAYIAARTFLDSSLTADANGPYYGLIDEPIQFTGSASNGIEPYSWNWDFGDGNTSDEQNPTHIYTYPDNFTVTLTVTDDSGNNSNDTTWAWIQVSNDPPNTPDIDGETSGKVGVEYEYTFVTIDPDGNDVWYYIEWDDTSNRKWDGPYASGEEITRTHTWSKKGTYTIRCKAMDVYGEESDWGELEVTMPMNQQSFYSQVLQFLQRLIQRFPLLEQLLSSGALYNKMLGLQ